MAEYANENKPIIFKNKTDSDFNVGVGIVFRKSGIYEISINDKTTTVTKILERKTGKWNLCTDEKHDVDYYVCSNCGYEPYRKMDISNFCPNCGADMRGEE